MESPAVLENVCRERRKVLDERCARDKSDILDQQARTQKLEEMSIVMGQILERWSGQLEDHDSRLKALESRPRTIVSKWETAIISSAAGLLFGALCSFLFG